LFYVWFTEIITSTTKKEQHPECNTGYKLFLLKSEEYGYCLSVTTQNNEKVLTMSKCSNDSPGQRWRQLIIPDQEGSSNLLMKICFDSGDNDKCLTISSSSNSEFRDVSLQTCMGKYYDQTWVISNYGHIVNMVTGSQLLALRGNSKWRFAVSVEMQAFSLEPKPGKWSLLLLQA